MHIKFLTHGTGSGAFAVRYLLGSHDHAGQERAEVRVLQGDPAMVGRLVDSLEFVQRYTSGVISWHVDDDPTDKEIDSVLTDFESIAFAGLAPSQVAWTAILHVDHDDSKHIHIFAARVELESGKSFNLAPPGWQSSFDPLRDQWNYCCGWARPDDPRRARVLQPGPLAAATKAKSHIAGVDDVVQALKLESDPKAALTDWLMAHLLAGQIQNRDDVIHQLQTVGQINRIGDDYISVRLPDSSKPIRLKGSLYASSLNVSAIRASASIGDVRLVKREREQPNPVAATRARADLDAAIARRSAYNLRHYASKFVQEELVSSCAPKANELKVDSPAKHVSAVTSLGTPATPSPHRYSKPQKKNEEKDDDTTGNNLARAAAKAFKFARAAYESLVRATFRSIRAIRNLERASGELDSESKQLEQATQRLKWPFDVAPLRRVRRQDIS